MGFIDFMRSTRGRLLRTTVGLALIAVGLLFLGGVAGEAVAVAGLLPLTAGVVNFCPAGPLFGVDFRGCPRSEECS